MGILETVVTIVGPLLGGGFAVAVVKRGEKKDAIDERTEKTFARLFESERKKREMERGDCTERITRLSGDLGELREEVRTCHENHAESVRKHSESLNARLTIEKELRELKEIVSFIRPDSEPPTRNI